MTETAAGGSRALVYDDAGRVTSATAVGRVLTFGYDPRGLLATSSDAFGTAEYEYDQAQRLTGLGATTYIYDTVGRVAAVRGITNLNYTYNAVGALNERTAVALTSPANTESRTYDAIGRVLSVKSAVATYGRDPLGRTTSRTSTGVAEQMGYRGATSTLSAYSAGPDTTMLARDPQGTLLAQATVGGSTGPSSRPSTETSVRSSTKRPASRRRPPSTTRSVRRHQQAAPPWSHWVTSRCSPTRSPGSST